MNRVQELITFLQFLIPAAAAARILYCLAASAMDADEEQSYRVRIRNALVFTILAEVISGIVYIVLSYF